MKDRWEGGIVYLSSCRKVIAVVKKYIQSLKSFFAYFDKDECDLSLGIFSLANSKMHKVGGKK